MLNHDIVSEKMVPRMRRADSRATPTPATPVIQIHNDPNEAQTAKPIDLTSVTLPQVPARKNLKISRTIGSEIDAVRTEAENFISAGLTAMENGTRCGFKTPGYDPVSVDDLIKAVRTGEQQLSQRLRNPIEMNVNAIAERKVASALVTVLQGFLLDLVAREHKNGVSRNDLNDLLPHAMQVREACDELALKYELMRHAGQDPEDGSVG